MDRLKQLFRKCSRRPAGLDLFPHLNDSQARQLIKTRLQAEGAPGTIADIITFTHRLGLDDENLDRVASHLVKKFPALVGEYSGFSNDGQDTRAECFAAKYVKHCIKRGIWSSGVICAIDSHGDIDCDHLNDGPEVDPRPQLTHQGYLAMLGQYKSFSRQRSFSSISTLSLDIERYYPEGEEPASCADDCWLKRDIPMWKPPQPSDTDAPLLYDVPDLESYIFSTISEGYTRIIHLPPAFEGTCLQIELLPMPIPSTVSSKITPEDVYTGPYEALSYTWGSDRSEYTIRCSGRALRITRNLHAALCQLQKADRHRWFWIDALCIDQSNDAEKSAQVARMMQIYQGAEAVTVWLGLGSSESALAFLYMKVLDSRRRRESIFDQKHEAICIDRMRRMYLAIASVSERPWFRRGWIRQELITANRVVVRCGTSELPWAVLKRSIKRLGQLRRALSEHGVDDQRTDMPRLDPLLYLTRGWTYGESVTRSMGNIRSIRYYHAGGLLDLLITGRDFGTTDPRDRVYSVIGLAKVPVDFSTAEAAAGSQAGKEVRLRVDYSRSVSEVYQDVAKYMVNDHRNLDILCILLGQRGRSSSDLPSWTPDWRVDSSEATLDDCRDYFSMKLGAAGFTKCEAQDLSDAGKLRVKGYLFDDVDELLDITTDFAGYMTNIYSHDDDIEKCTSVTCKFDPSIHQRRVCRTLGKRLALVPRAARTGDALWILLGCKLPMVLRQDENQKAEAANSALGTVGKWEVVGPVFATDVMWGRVMRHMFESGIEARQLTLI